MRIAFFILRLRPREFAWSVLVALTAGVSLAATSHGTEVAAPIRAGDPIYRELRLADLLGLTAEPLRGQEPLSRAEVFRLLKPLAAGISRERGLVPVAEDLNRGITRTVAYRLTRARDWINPWDVFWEKGLYPVTFDLNVAKRVEITGSDIDGGLTAPRYLDFGENRTEGAALIRDGALFIEGDWVAIAADWRLRIDRDAVTYRPLTLAARLGAGNWRLTVGREPVAWGPERHGQLLLSTNARPLDQLRLESERPFFLPGLRPLGSLTASVFAGKLDDPGRTDAASPWLTGMRVTYVPRRWLVLGATRTTMLGGGGHDFAITPRTLADLFLARNENRETGDDANDTDHKATVDWSLYLWPLLRGAPLLDGGRLYGQYGGEDSPQSGPLPSATGHTYGIELVARGVLIRAEASNVRDDRNLWYWHLVYTDGYTYRGRVMGHPMGGDSRAESYVVEAPIGTWGLAVASMERQEHGFHARPGAPPSRAQKPIPYGVQDIFTLAVEKHMGRFPGSIRLEGRALRTWGDQERLGPLEDWGVSLEWRR